MPGLFTAVGSSWMREFYTEVKHELLLMSNNGAQMGRLVRKEIKTRGP